MLMCKWVCVYVRWLGNNADNIIKNTLLALPLLVFWKYFDPLVVPCLYYIETSLS